MDGRKECRANKKGKPEADRGCSVAADGQLIVDHEDEFDDFGDSKCSLCQRRFEEQGKGTRHLQKFKV